MRTFWKYYVDQDAIGGDIGGGGGDPKPPTPPKGYAPTTVDQRSQWNSFLDYAGKQSGGNLNDPKGQTALLAQYKKENPNFSITAEQIPNIQYEAYQLRKGEKFGNLGTKELGYLRQGFSPNFLNADTANVGKLYYPHLGSYGTDIENYYNSKFNPATAPAAAAKVVAMPAPASVTPPPAGAAPAVEEGPLPAGTTPRPDYSNPASRANYLKTLASQPGNDFISGKQDGVKRGDTIIHINEIPSYGTISNRQAALQEAAKHGLDPALLYSSTMEEGANGYYPDAKGDINSGEGTSDKYPVSGFGNYGVDNFHTDFKEMVKKGYLSKDFDYEKSPHKNENGDDVQSANFKNTEDAMKAKAAYLHLYRDHLDDYTKTNNITLSPVARQFFTLIGFNGGDGTAHKLLKYYQAHGLLDGDKFLQHPPDEDVDPGGAFKHVLPRLQMANLLKKEAYFK